MVEERFWYIEKINCIEGDMNLETISKVPLKDITEKNIQNLLVILASRDLTNDEIVGGLKKKNKRNALLEVRRLSEGYGYTAGDTPGYYARVSKITP